MKMFVRVAKLIADGTTMADFKTTLLEKHNSVMAREMTMLAQKDDITYQISHAKKGKYKGSMRVSIWVGKKANHMGWGDTLLDAWNDALRTWNEALDG
jgi:hypothetical protein